METVISEDQQVIEDADPITAKLALHQLCESSDSSEVGGCGGIGLIRSSTVGRSVMEDEEVLSQNGQAGNNLLDW